MKIMDILNFLENFDMTPYVLDKQYFKTSGKKMVFMDENEDEILLEISLPGYEKSDIDISMQDRVLTVKTKDDLNETFWKSKFKENYSFDKKQISTNKIKATFKNGILQIILPLKDDAKPKEIKIE
jgi:HSP20 family protein